MAISKLDRNQDRFLEKSVMVDKINEIIDVINALQEQSAGEILQREPSETGKRGRGRPRMEQSEQGQEITK